MLHGLAFAAALVLFADVAQAQQLAVPTLLEPTAGNEQVTLTWSSADLTIPEYEYRYRADNDTFGDAIKIPDSDSSNFKHTVTRLDNGTRYTFEIRSKRSSNVSRWSNSDEAIPLGPPAAPTNLDANAGDPAYSAISLTWKAPAADAARAAVSGYLLEWSANSSGPWTEIDLSGDTGTSYQHSGLAAASTYHYRVHARSDASGDSDASAIASADTAIAPPAAPTGLAAAVGDAQLTLSWSNPSDSTIDKYQYSTNAGSSYSDITGSGASTTTHTVTGLTNGTEYTLAVRAVNDSGNGAAATVTETPIAKPAAPTGLAAAVGDAQLTLSWSNPSDSTIDKYQYSTNAGSSYSDITGSGASTTTHTVTGLTNGTEYTLAVRAVNESGNGAAATVTETPLGPPAAPTGLAAAVGDAQLTLSWSNPSDSTIDKYQYSTNAGSSYSDITGSGASTTTHTVTGLTNGTEYTLAVRAVNESGNGAAATVTETPIAKPAAPTGLAAAVGDAQLTLSWSNPSDSTIDKYQYSTNAGSSYSDITGSGASTTTHTVTGLTNGTEYTLAVRAVNESGNGAAATVTETPIAKPAAPTGLAAAVGDAQLTLSWSNPSDSTIDKYQYSTNAGSSYSDITGSGASTTTHTVTGLTNGTEYTLAVRAVNESGNGAAATVTETPIAKPAAPTGLAAAVGDAQLTLSWSNPSDSTIDKYQYSTNAGSSYSDITGSGASTTTHTVTGLTNGTEYTLAVRAVNESGNGAAATVTETPIAKPAAPTGLAAAVGDAQLTLSWSNPSDSTIDKYQYSTNAGSSYSDITGSGASTTTHTVTGLTNGTEYTLAVRAVNESGNGAAATVTETPIAKPAAPTGLAAAVGDAQLTLSWSNPSDSTIDKYQYSTNAGSSYSDITGSGASTTTHTVTGLTNGTEYTLAVRAVNESGNGAAATVTETPIAKPAAPTGLAAAVGDAQLTLSWSNPSDSTIDKYQYSTNAGSSYSDITGSGASTTTHTVTGLTNGTEYTLAVRAVNESGNGAAATVTETPIAKPAAPTGLAAAVGDAQLTLSWSNPSDSTIDKYQYSTNAGSSYSDITGSGASTTTHTVTGLTNGTEYTLAVRAVNESGNGAAATVTETPIAKPAAPTGLAAAVGDAQLTLSWDDPSNDTITAYRFRQSTDNGATFGAFTTIADSADITSHTVTGLTNGTTYTFEVQAQNASGWSASSSQATATPALPAPVAPANLSAAAGDGQVTLSWDDPSNDTITAYRFRQSTDNGATFGAFTTIADSADITSHTVTGLTNGTAYTFKIQATNNIGWSRSSNQATATPLRPRFVQPAPAAVEFVEPPLAEPQFMDVDPSSVHANNIQTLLAAGITTGCRTDPPMYCPDRAVTRAQMASFVVRALKMHTASPRKTERIIDVDPSSVHANNIDVLFAAGITTGCGTELLRYCPDRAVTRAQMASFLARALDLPAAAFARRAPKIMDLDSSSVHATNIKALFAARITTGCRTDPLRYCPDRPVTRSQMASFLVRAFDLD